MPSRALLGGISCRSSKDDQVRLVPVEGEGTPGAEVRRLQQPINQADPTVDRTGNSLQVSNESLCLHCAA
jgi:hypothetical protein